MLPAEKTIRDVRLLHAVFLATVFLFVVVVHLAAPPERPVEPMIPIAIACVAMADVGLAFVRRRTLMAKVAETFERSAFKALEQWRTANIFSFTHAESIVLFGVVLRFLGTSWKIAGPFFAAGFLLLLFWMPKLDLPISGESSSPPPIP